MELNRFYKRKGFCSSLVDTPCKTADDAREIESLLKEAEKQGGGYKRLAFVSDLEAKAADENEKHTALITASTTDIDREKEVVQVSGINLKQFRKNPVIAWGHDYSQPPVGRSLWEKVDGDSLKSKIKFADRPSDWPTDAPWFADQLFALAEQGILKGVSIGFITLESSAPTEKEIKARPELAGAKSIVRKSNLLEISLVPIPMNQSGLIESVKKGLVSPEFAEMLGVKIQSEPELDLWSWEAKDFAKPEIIEVKALPTKLDLLQRIHKGLNR